MNVDKIYKFKQKQTIKVIKNEKFDFQIINVGYGH